MTRFVSVTVEGSRVFALGARRNDRLGATLLNLLNQSVGVIPLVGRNRLGARREGQEVRRLRDIRFVGAGDREPKRVAEGIRDAVDLAAEAAARASQSLRAEFFLAPAAC